MGSRRGNKPELSFYGLCPAILDRLGIEKLGYRRRGGLQEKGTLHFLFTTVKSLEVQVFVFRKENREI